MQPILTVYIHGVTESQQVHALRRIQRHYTKHTIVGVSNPYRGDVHYYVAYRGRKRVLRRAMDISKLQAAADYTAATRRIFTGGVEA